jgi:hypothetical protein
MPNASAAIQFDYRPRVRLVANARALVKELCDDILSDPDAASRIALTAHEMMENVVKYSAGGKSSVTVELRDQDGRVYVQVRTKNRAGPAEVERLRLVIDQVDGAADPLAFYDAAIARSATAEGSGLGLARIRAEAEMSLAMSVEGDEVTLSAEAPVNLRERS